MNTELQDFVSTLSDAALTGDTLTLRGGVKVKFTKTESGKWCIEVNGTKTTGAKLKTTFLTALSKAERGMQEAFNTIQYAQHQIRSVGLFEQFEAGCKRLPGEMVRSASATAYGDRVDGTLKIPGYDATIYISTKGTAWEMSTTPPWADTLSRFGPLAASGTDVKAVFASLVRKVKVSAAEHIARSNTAVTSTTSLIARLETLV